MSSGETSMGIAEQPAYSAAIRRPRSASPARPTVAFVYPCECLLTTHPPQTVSSIKAFNKDHPSLQFHISSTYQLFNHQYTPSALPQWSLAAAKRPWNSNGTPATDLAISPPHSCKSHKSSAPSVRFFNRRLLPSRLPTRSFLIWPFQAASNRRSEERRVGKECPV